MSIFASTWQLTLWKETFCGHCLYIYKQRTKISVYRTYNKMIRHFTEIHDMMTTTENTLKIE